MRLPVEIRLYVYELALKDILAHIESLESHAPSVQGAKPRFRGALALLLTSKTIRAEFSEGVMPLVAARCEDFSAYVNMLELNWKVEVMMRGPCSSWEQVMYRQHSLGDAPVVMRALSTVKHIMKRSADENVKSSNDIDDESFTTNA